jgi:hypothetical protein
VNIIERLQAAHTPKPGEYHIEAAPAQQQLTPTGVTPTGPGWGYGITRLAPFDFAPPPWMQWSRQSAMTIPTVARSRNLIVGAISVLPLTLWKISFDPVAAQPVEQMQPPSGWMYRPDPTKTRSHIIGWTVDDLIWEARAYWEVTSRYSTGYPQTFKRLPAAQVQVNDRGEVRHNEISIDPANVIEFLSTHDALMLNGWLAVQTALELEMAATRFAKTEVPAGWLQQKDGGEPMSGDELSLLAQDFATLRQTNVIAALNNVVDYHESTLDPAKLQLLEARGFQALELSRLMNVPAYFVGAPVTGRSVTYNNAEMLRQDLIDFSCLPFIAVIEQVLSGPNVTPGTQFVRFDLNAWLRTQPAAGVPAPNDAQIADNTNQTNDSTLPTSSGDTP